MSGTQWTIVLIVAALAWFAGSAFEAHVHAALERQRLAVRAEHDRQVLEAVRRTLDNTHAYVDALRAMYPPKTTNRAEQ